MNEENKFKLRLIVSELIFGTISLFVKNINLPTPVIVLFRGYVGGLCILATIWFKKEKIDKEALKKNKWLIILSGIFMGLDWLLFFEAYNYASVAVVTILYYMESVYLTILTPIVLKEKLTLKKCICVAVALIGMVFVTGVLEGKQSVSAMGIIISLVAGLFYALVVIINKKMTPIPAKDKTSCQLIIAATVMLPYALLTSKGAQMSFDTTTIICLLCLCFIHTGFAYVNYFNSLSKVRTQSVAIIGYIDPIVSVILSALVLKEAFSLSTGIGAFLVLGSTFVSEWEFKKKDRK